MRSTIERGVSGMYPGYFAFLRDIVPFLKGFTLFFWATATWWIPLLLVLTVWRYAYRRTPLRYDPQFWGMVFPLGMYTASTVQLSRLTALGFLLSASRGLLYAAVLAWLLTFAGLVRSSARTLFSGLPEAAVTSTSA